MFDVKTIGNRIYARRKELDMSLDYIAVQIHVARSTIQRYEKGLIERPKVPVLHAIAKTLKVDPDWLLGISDSTAPPAVSFSLTPEEQTLIRCYRIASADDRAMVVLALKKYHVNSTEEKSRSHTPSLSERYAEFQTTKIDDQFNVAASDGTEIPLETAEPEPTQNGQEDLPV